MENSVRNMCISEGFLTRAEGFHVDVFTHRVFVADFFSLLHKQPVHSIDGRGYIIGSQIKRG